MAGDVGVFQSGRAATQVEGGTWLIDLGFQGRGRVVAAYLLVDRSELALIETGPSSTLPTLLTAVRQAGFDPGRIRKVLVTHIHLDHAGAAGPARARQPRDHRLRPPGWRPAHDRPVQAGGQRRANLRGPDGAALGRGRAGAGGAGASVGGRRDAGGGWARAAGRLHARARLAPRHLLRRRARRRLHGRRLWRAHARHRLQLPADAPTGPRSGRLGRQHRAYARARRAPLVPDPLRAVRRRGKPPRNSSSRTSTP